MQLGAARGMTPEDDTAAALVQRENATYRCRVSSLLALRTKREPMSVPSIVYLDSTMAGLNGRCENLSAALRLCRSLRLSHNLFKQQQPDLLDSPPDRNRTCI